LTGLNFSQFLQDCYAIILNRVRKYLGHHNKDYPPGIAASFQAKLNITENKVFHWRGRR